MGGFLIMIRRIQMVEKRFPLILTEPLVREETKMKLGGVFTMAFLKFGDSRDCSKIVSATTRKMTDSFVPTISRRRAVT